MALFYERCENCWAPTAGARMALAMLVASLPCRRLDIEKYISYFCLGHNYFCPSLEKIYKSEQRREITSAKISFNGTQNSPRAISST